VAQGSEGQGADPTPAGRSVVEQYGDLVATMDNLVAELEGKGAFIEPAKRRIINYWRSTAVGCMCAYTMTSLGYAVIAPGETVQSWN
jgi:hypothetical protein